VRTSLVVLAFFVSACSKSEGGGGSPPAPTAEEGSATPAVAEPPIVFDPKMPSFKCGNVRCNIDYYCVQRKQGSPTEVCTSHPPRKREGCTKVADRTFTCETFP
jgi:hypothetical protein